MPSPTVATALALAQANNGAPWDFDAWKDITGIESGLFPEEDGSLPPGISRTDANEIATYFDVLNKKVTLEKQIQFSRAKDRYVGRAKWNTWVAKRYQRWGMHDIAVKAMMDNNCHPHLIMKADGLDIWPDATFVLSLVQPALGLALFGSDGLTSLNMVRPDLRTLVNTISNRAIESLKTRFQRMQKTAKNRREIAENAYKGMC
jgi:hypothetical protein